MYPGRRQFTSFDNDRPSGPRESWQRYQTGFRAWRTIVLPSEVRLLVADLALTREARYYADGSTPRWHVRTRSWSRCDYSQDGRLRRSHLFTIWPLGRDEEDRHQRHLYSLSPHRDRWQNINCLQCCNQHGNLSLKRLTNKPSQSDLGSATPKTH